VSADVPVAGDAAAVGLEVGPVGTLDLVDGAMGGGDRLGHRVGAKAGSTRGHRVETQAGSTSKRHCGRKGAAEARKKPDPQTAAIVVALNTTFEVRVRRNYERAAGSILSSVT
jgi:hypothetical protein